MPQCHRIPWGRYYVVVWLTILGWSVFLLGSGWATAAVSEPPSGVTLHEGRLSVRVVNRPLWQVLAEVSRLSHAEVVWLSQEGQEAPVSVEFADLPLLEGLERILHQKNFLLFCVPQPSGLQVTHLWIASDQKPTQPPPPLQVAASSPSPRDEKATAAPSQSAGTPAGRTVGQRVVQMATSAPSPLTRANAVVYLGMHMDDEPQTKELLEQIARGDQSSRVREAATQALQRNLSRLP